MKKDLFIEISHKLKLKRTAMRKTLKEMAVAADVSYQTLSSYENRLPKYPKKEILEKISRCYGVPLDDLIAGGIKVEEDERRDYIVRGSEENITLSEEHSDKKALRDITNLFTEGTGLLSIGDLVSRIRKYGGEEEENELLDAQLEFQDKATRIWRRIRTKQDQQKKIY